jgi:hypothetical protein
VLVKIVIVVVLALAVAGGLGLSIRRAASNARTIDVPAGEPDRIFWGGVMCRYVITSGNLARLEFFDWGVRIRGIVASRWVVPTWEARYEELAIAELVSLPRSSRCSSAVAWLSTARWPRSGGQRSFTARRAEPAAHQRPCFSLAAFVVR